MKLKGTWPKRLLRWGGELLLLLVLLLASEAWMTRSVPRGIPVTLAAQRLDGQSFDISQWRGQSGIIYFWAEWCPVCKANRHVITSLAERERVMTVAMQSGSASEVAAYMQQEQFTLPVIVDEQGVLARRFQVSGVPVALIIDRDGRISYVARGYTTELGLRLRLWLAS